ncbi:type IV secretory system conjugative DNA transfer family protein [Serratia marcescens]
MKLKLIVLLTLPLLAANVARADDSDVKGLDYYMDPPSQSDDEADVTGSMLNDAAHTIGFRGGKAERAKEIRAALENQRSNLDYMYSFQPLISSEGYLPPVIAEAKDVAHITNEQIRTANRAYDIVVPARFVSKPQSDSERLGNAPGRFDRRSGSHRGRRIYGLSGVKRGQVWTLTNGVMPAGH